MDFFNNPVMESTPIMKPEVESTPIVQPEESSSEDDNESNTKLLPMAGLLTLMRAGRQLKKKRTDRGVVPITELDLCRKVQNAFFHRKTDDVPIEPDELAACVKLLKPKLSSDTSDVEWLALCAASLETYNAGERISEEVSERFFLCLGGCVGGWVPEDLIDKKQVKKKKKLEGHCGTYVLCNRASRFAERRPLHFRPVF